MFYLNQSQYSMIKTFSAWFFGYLLLAFAILAIYYYYNNIQDSKSKDLRKAGNIFNKLFLALCVAEMVVVLIDNYTPTIQGLVKFSSVLIPVFGVGIIIVIIILSCCYVSYDNEKANESKR